MLRFMHIPKTAGTSLVTALKQQFGDGLIRDRGDQPDPRLAPFVEPTTGMYPVSRIVDIPGVERALAAANAKALFGHGLYVRWAWLVPPERTIVFLREPVARVLSAHQHFIRRFGSAAPPILHYARQRPNSQSRHVEGLDLSRAFVGLVEQYERSLQDLNKRFDLQLQPATRNVNPRKPLVERYEVDPEVVAEIERLNADDVALYKHACRLVRPLHGSA